jgi:hypothetical protein
MNLSFRGCFRSALRPLLCGLLALTGLGLGACNNAISTGVAPQYLVVSKPGTVAAVPSLQMWQCLTSGLSAIMYFSNGSAGNFTNRVKWSSSNTGAVEVSNNDIQIPGSTSFYPPGTLVPVGAGTAIITANYYGILSQTSISVAVPEYFKMQGYVQGLRVPLDYFNDVYHSGTATDNAFSMGVGTTLQLSVIANLAGTETDVSSFGTWGFMEPTTNATINATTGLITAVAEGTNMIPTISFPSCPDQLTSPLQQFTLTTSQVKSIAFSPEFDPGTATSQPTQEQLYVGNTEKFNVLATLNNGALQDVSAQSAYSANASNMVFASGSTAVNVLDGVGVGAGNVSAIFSAGGTALTTGVINVNVVPGQLQTIFICWSTPLEPFNASTVCQDPQDQGLQPGAVLQGTASVVGGSLTPVIFHAIGTYGTNSSGDLLTQEVTRQTTWVSGNVNAATISSASGTSGQAIGLDVGSILVSITANYTPASAQGVNTATTQVQVEGSSPSSPTSN